MSECIMARDRFKHSASVFGIIRRGSSILSLRRYGTGWLDGHWSVPAGAVDGNETLPAAAAREVLEEVGLLVPAADARLAHVQQVLMPARNGSVSILRLRTPDLEPSMMEPDKHDRMEWLDLMSISEPVVPYVRAALSDISDEIEPMHIHDARGCQS
jgi:8-oxo-dGTP pyrophosphatase MutT (NUDIX family)